MRALRILYVLLLLSTVALAADSPFTGTWKLNLQKSKPGAGDPTKSDIHRIVVNNQDISDQEEWSDGKENNHIKVEAKIDGKDYPVSGDPGTDTMSYQQRDRVNSPTQRRSRARLCRGGPSRFPRMGALRP
jgi:hypothetical protein